MWKILIVVVGILMTISTPAFAGIMSVLNAVKETASTGNLWVGLAVLILGWVMKSIPNDKIYTFVFAFFEKIGTVCTLGLSKYKWTAPLWNQYIEAYVIDTIENTVGAALNGFIKGLRSDTTIEHG